MDTDGGEDEGECSSIRWHVTRTEGFHGSTVWPWHVMRRKRIHRPTEWLWRMTRPATDCRHSIQKKLEELETHRPMLLKCSGRIDRFPNGPEEARNQSTSNTPLLSVSHRPNSTKSTKSTKSIQQWKHDAIHKIRPSDKLLLLSSEAILAITESHSGRYRQVILTVIDKPSWPLPTKPPFCLDTASIQPSSLVSGSFLSPFWPVTANSFWPSKNLLSIVLYDILTSTIPLTLLNP